MNLTVCCCDIKHVGLLASQQSWQKSVSELHRIVLYLTSTPHQPPPPQCRWTGKAAVGLYVMQVIAWCVYSYSAPFPSLHQLNPVDSPAGFPHVSLLWGQQRQSRLAHRVTPAIGGGGKTKKKRDCICFHWAQPPVTCLIILFVSILFLWLMLKGPHSVSGFPHAPRHHHHHHPSPLTFTIFLNLRSTLD